MNEAPSGRPLPPVSIPADRYDQVVWTHLKAFEGAADRIYTDGKGIPTMGAGVALAVIGPDHAWVLRPAAEIGAESSGDPRQPYRFSAEEWQRLTLCLQALNQAEPYQAQALIPPFDPGRESAALNRFGFTLTESRIQAQTLPKWSAARRAVLGDILTETLRRGIGKEVAAAYGGTSQEVGLASVCYNIGVGRTTPKAIAALLDGDRARLWYEIACNTNPPGNGSSRAGIARRRLAEARLACGDPDQWSPADQTALRQVMIANAEAVAAYRRAVPVILPFS